MARTSDAAALGALKGTAEVAAEGFDRRGDQARANAGVGLARMLHRRLGGLAAPPVRHDPEAASDLSGLSPARIAKIEKGQDVQWSTLCQLFAGFGCGITIVPMSRFGADELWRRTHDLWGDGHIARRRRYPRK